MLLLHVQLAFTLIGFGCLSFGKKLRVGGLFERFDPNQQLVFQIAVDEVNSKQNYPIFEGLSATIPQRNTLMVSKELCSIVQKGVVGLIGPSSSFTSPYVQSLCDIKDLPHVETHWDIDLKHGNTLINLHPYPPVLSEVFKDVIKNWGWSSFTILYDDDDSLSHISDVLRIYKKSEHSIIVRQIDPEKNGNYRPMLMQAKNGGETHFAIDCSVSVLEELFRQAQQVGLMTERHNYIVFNLDMFTIDLSPYQYGGTNITGFRLIDPQNPQVIKFAQQLQKLRESKGLSSEAFGHLAAWKFTTRSALIADGIYLLHEAIKSLDDIDNGDVKPLYCHDEDTWKSGLSIINDMRTKTLRGLTGLIKFDNQGFRSDFTLDIVEVSEGGLTKVGEWSTKFGLNISRIEVPEDLDVDERSLKHKHFIVITALTAPYSMLKEASTMLIGNDRFEGYAIDLIFELSQMLGFNYTFVVQEDGDNGNYNEMTGKWSGMIGEIINGNADLAITDLTITYDRERYVDFSMPFMTLGISILYRKPEPVPPSLLTFASPFSVEVWIMLGAAYFLVSFSFFIMGRLSPREWTNPYPCIQEPEYLINQFSLRNSCWFTMGSLMQQGSEIAPIGVSTRLAAGAWWFFTLIIVSSYTANLAAFLTVEVLVSPFSNVEELAQQTDIKYGAKAGGATYNFFRNSNISVYPIIKKYMNSHSELMTQDNNQGVEKVESENYAFFMESTTIEYVVERRCKLAQVGGLLDEKGYGIAMRKHSKYRNVLSQAVLKLQESGVLTSLKIKWWKSKRGGGNCEDREGEATPLDLQNLGGVFFVLTVGTILGFLSTFLEMGLHILKASYKRKISFKEEVREELKLFVKFHERTKAVRRSQELKTASEEN